MKTIKRVHNSSISKYLRKISTRQYIRNRNRMILKDETNLVNKNKNIFLLNLRKNLASEERNNKTSFHKYLKDFLKESKWRLKFNSNNSFFILNKMILEYEITIIPQIKQGADSKNVTPKSRKNNSKPAQNHSESIKKKNRINQKQNDFCNFLVTIKSEEKPKMMVIDISSKHSGLEINHLFMTDNVFDLIPNVQTYSMYEQYMGPRFEKLKNDLQLEIFEFIISLGIDQDLNEFLDYVSFEFESDCFQTNLENNIKFLF
jgi:hypothetical protein